MSDKLTKIEFKKRLDGIFGRHLSIDFWFEIFYQSYKKDRVKIKEVVLLVKELLSSSQ